MKFTCVFFGFVLLLVLGFTQTEALSLTHATHHHPIEKREVPVAADLRNTPCAPNDYFKIDCNTCYCNLERSGYLCTENFCTEDRLHLQSEIKLSNDTKVVISNGDVKLIRGNETTLIDNSLRAGKAHNFREMAFNTSTQIQTSLLSHPVDVTASSLAGFSNVSSITSQ